MNSLEPFRVVGSVCGDVPVASTLLYGVPLLMVPLGNSFLLYKGKQLLLLRGGPHYQEKVTAVGMSGKYRAVAEGPRLHMYVHHKLLWTMYHSPVLKTIPATLLLAQDDLLFAVGTDHRIVVREIKTGETLNAFDVVGNEQVTSFSVLPGYSNKLLCATKEGTLQLFNYKTGECLLHAYPLGSPEEEGSKKKKKGAQVLQHGRESILSLCCSKYKDIVAFGTSQGKVVLYNIRDNEEITQFEHHSRSAVTALAFRSDKEGFLFSGSSTGEVLSWDVEHRCLDGMLSRTKQVVSGNSYTGTGQGAEDGGASEDSNVHGDAVLSLITFDPFTTQGEANAAELMPLLTTVGADNCMTQFRFDTVDGLGLLVRERRGHESGCTAACFYNQELLVTSGTDRAVRATHIFSDRASWELSQGKLSKKTRDMRLQHPNHLLSANKTHSQDLLLGKGRNMLKLPPATQLVAASTRNYQWASILSLHEASSLSCGWRLDTRALAFKLSGIQTGAHTARSIAISDCGNFAVVGYSSGNVTVITLQNKSIRQLIDPSLERVEGGFPPRTHDSAVECVEVTGGNQVIFTASLDCCLKYWDLRSGKLLTTTKTTLPASKSCVHPSADLVMVVQHLSVYIYHSNPHRFSVAGQEEEKEGALEVEDSFHHPVRVLHGHTSPITAIALAPDTYRYLATAGGDGSLLLWDISASACVGQYRFLSPALSLHFHPDALFLATTHAGERGAFLWVNNLRYGYVPEVVPHPEEIPTETLTCLHFPTTHGTEEEEEEKGGEETESQRALRAAESDKVEADLFDPKRDVALQQQKRLHEAYAYLDGLPADGVQLAADLPRSLWWNVPLVEEMKEKNQPLLPAKKKDVPFFLPQTQELRPTFLVVASDAGKRTEGDKGEDTARDMNLNQLTPFQKLLRQRQFDEALQYLVALQTAPAIDLEVRQLAIYHHTGSLEEEVVYTEAELLQMNDTLTSFLELVHFFLKERRAVDLVQGLLADFLRCHVSLLTRLIGSNAPRLGDLLRSVMEEQRLVKDTVRHMVAYPDCLVNTFTGSSFI